MISPLRGVQPGVPGGTGPIRMSPSLSTEPSMGLVTRRQDGIQPSGWLAMVCVEFRYVEKDIRIRWGASHRLTLVGIARHLAGVTGKDQASRAGVSKLVGMLFHPSGHLH